MRENYGIEHYSNRQVLFAIKLMEPAALSILNSYHVNSFYMKFIFILNVNETMYNIVVSTFSRLF